MSIERNVYQVLDEEKAHERLSEIDAPYRVLGGIAAHAILNANIIHWEDRIIEVDCEVHLSTRRENDTVRDIDTLIVSSSSQEVNKAKEALTDVVGNDLSVSVFGLRKRVKTRKTLIPNMDFVSHRTIDEEGNFYIHLDEVETALTNDWYDAWEVRRPQDDSPLFQTLSPVAIEAGYRMRSITGVRPKDKDKLEKLRERISLDDDLANAQLTESLSAVYTAQQAAGRAHALAIEEKRNTSKTWFRTKAMLLGHLECQPRLVEWAQSKLEPVLSPIVGRK